jgi:hypothetical protein
MTVDQDAARRFREAMRDVADAMQRAADTAGELAPGSSYSPSTPGVVDDVYLAFTHGPVLREGAAKYAPYLKTKTPADEVMRAEVALQNR